MGMIALADRPGELIHAEQQQVDDQRQYQKTQRIPGDGDVDKRDVRVDKVDDLAACHQNDGRRVDSYDKNHRKKNTETQIKNALIALMPLQFADAGLQCAHAGRGRAHQNDPRGNCHALIDIHRHIVHKIGNGFQRSFGYKALEHADAPHGERIAAAEHRIQQNDQRKESHHKEIAQCR